MELNEQSDRAVLPPLPPSDEKSIAWNTRDSFYDTKSRDFWEKNQIVREKLEDYKKCQHYFVPKGQSVECKHCHVGYMGFFEIREGELFLKGEPIKFEN